MRFFKQRHKFSCGPACAGMMLSSLGITVTEEELILLMGCAAGKGTHCEDWFKLETAFPVTLMVKAQGRLAELRELRERGWRLTLLITSEVPHYVVFRDFVDGQVTYHDPWDGPDLTVSSEEFLGIWSVDEHWPVYQSNQWFVGLTGR